MKTNRKHGFTVVELVVVIAIIAVLAAVLIPTFASIIKKANDSAYLQERTNHQIEDLAEKVENQNYLTWEDFEAVLARELAKVGSPDTEAIKNAVKVALAERAGSDNGLSEAQVQKIINEAMSGQLTTAQVQAIVEQSIKNAGISVGTSGGVTAAQVKSIVSAAIANIPTQTGVTPEMVKNAVASALANANVTVNQDDIAKALKAFGVSTLTEEQIVEIATQIATQVSEKTGNEKIVATLNIRAAGNEKATLYDTFGAMSISDPTTAVKSISAGETILWDSVDKKFVLDKDNTLTGARYWTVSDVISDKWSTYYTGTASTISTTKGFDAGTTTSVTSVTYTNSDAQTVVIRTNSANTTLTIDDKSTGTINHYGSAGELNIIQCHTASYHENGTVAFAEISKGRIVLENGSKIDHIHVNANENANGFDTVIIADNGAKELPEAITRDEVTVEAKTLVVKVESNGTTEEVYVYADGTSGTTEKTTTQNTEVESALGKLVLDNGEESKALNSEAKTEVQNDVVDNAIEKEDLASEENATARYWIDIAADEFAGGTGTESDPYLISSARQLALLSEIMAGYNTEKSYSNYCDKYYKLTKDIDLTGKVWISIGIGDDGNGINPFKGHIDGNNKTVYNMSSLDATYEELEAHKMGTWSTALGKTVAQDGFVGYAQDATIKNLKIVGAVFENSKFEKSGFIVCCANGNTVLENCHVDSTSKYNGKSNIGGLVGLYKVPGENGLILKNCSSAASITVNSNRGAGFVGAFYDYTKMFATDCTFSGTINGNRIGGFIGRSPDGMNSDFSGYHFKNCHMLGTLTPNSAGDYGYVEAWQSGSIPYITLDGCTYKDATDGIVKAFALTDAHIFGYLEGTSAWFGVDEKLNDYPSPNTSHFPDASYSVDFENHTISYTIAENGTISLGGKDYVYDFSRVTFIGHDGVEIIISNASNFSWSVKGNTQFFEEDGETLFTGMTLNSGAGIYWTSTKFAWDSTLNGWKLIEKNFRLN